MPHRTLYLQALHAAHQADISGFPHTRDALLKVAECLDDGADHALDSSPPLHASGFAEEPALTVFVPKEDLANCK